MYLFPHAGGIAHQIFCQCFINHRHIVHIIYICRLEEPSILERKPLDLAVSRSGTRNHDRIALSAIFSCQIQRCSRRCQGNLIFVHQCIDLFKLHGVSFVVRNTHRQKIAAQAVDLICH